MASTGLLLLTNDSRFADWVTDPANRVPRTCVVTVGGERLTAARIEVRKRSRRETHLVVELTEGKNREIRRLFEEVGHEVTRLKRVAFGGLTRGGLAPGKWRAVSKAELRTAFPNAPVSRMPDPHLEFLRRFSLTCTKTVV
jgi:23S rRNA pseudouridine2605 synthase